MALEPALVVFSSLRGESILKGINPCTPLIRTLGVALLVLGLAIGLVACGGTSSSSSETTSGSTTEEATTSPASEKEGSGGAGGVKVWDEAMVEKPSEQALNKFAGEIVAPGFKFAELPGYTHEMYEIAAQKITPELEEQLSNCLKNNPCQTGHGEYSIALDMGQESGYESENRAIQTLTLLRYPSVKEITVLFTGSELSKAQANLQSLITKHVSAIMGVFPFGDAMEPLVKQAASAGIPVIAWSQTIPSDPQDGSGLAGFVNLNTCELGAGAAEAAIAEGPPHGTVAMYTGIPGNPYAAEWQPCAKKAYEKAGWTVGTEGNTEWLPQGEQEAAAALVSKGLPNAVQYDSDPTQFIKAFSAEGGDGDLPVVTGGSASFSAYGEWLKAKESGHEVKTLAVSSGLGFTYAVPAMLVAAAAGETPENVPFKVIIPTKTIPYEDLARQYYPSLPPEADFNSALPPNIAQESLEGH